MENPKKIMRWKTEGKRPPGRPSSTLKDYIKINIK
jgi:hypothetical protein